MILSVVNRESESGFTLIEVLVTLVIIAIGLLGLAGLQVTTLKSQLETYQRAQAMLLVEDMVNRIRVNTIPARAGAYTPGEEYGLLDSADLCPNPATATTAELDICAWNDAIAGTAVTLSGEDVGSMIGARGCIATVAGSVDGEFIVRVTVAWQGALPTIAPLSTCGEDEYGDDNLRRVVSMDAVLANLAL